jgi:hypothetical protein
MRGIAAPHLPSGTVHESYPFTRLRGGVSFCHSGTSDYHHWQFFHRGNDDVVIGDFPIYFCLRMKWVLCGQFPIHHLP